MKFITKRDHGKGWYLVSIFPTMKPFCLPSLISAKESRPRFAAFFASIPMKSWLPNSPVQAACVGPFRLVTRPRSENRVARFSDLLKEFVRLNQGKLEIYSNDGYAIVDKDGERFENRDLAFEGTVVHITLRCDEKLYRFRDEAE